MASIPLSTPIVMLHGLGGKPITLLPTEWMLRFHYGYSNVFRPTYPVDVFRNLERGLDVLDLILLEMGLDKETPLVVIGQSMGGVYANKLHERGWQVLLSITIGSPLNGARLLTQLEPMLPEVIKRVLHKPPYDHLKQMLPASAPPHPYKTITLGWALSDFDGCVYKSDAMIDPAHNTHLAFADHRTIFANPRLGYTLAQMIKA